MCIEDLNEPFVPAKVIASRLNCHVRTVLRAAARGEIPKHYVPGTRRPRFRWSEVQEVVLRRKRGSDK